MPKKTLAILILLLIPMLALADEPVSKSRFRGIAIGGHDTVAYHSLVASPQEEARKGIKTWVVDWKKAKWQFLSKESADKFAANPDHYAPAFNGFCANALSLGEGLVRTDGTHWEIIDKRLYLFYASAGRDRWVSAGASVSDYIAEAEAAFEILK